MLRPASRALARPSTIRSITRVPSSRHFLSTASPNQQSRSWKNYGVRLALAAGAIYYYNTNDLFAEEPAFRPRSADYENEPENVPTIEDLQEKRKEQRARLEQLKQEQILAEEAISANKTNFAPGQLEGDGSQGPGSVEELEEEAGQQGAFNPETGEINWDCSCLGGMAHGPCGEEFRAAFSCFVYSDAEPKGMDCIDKFQGMQTCFRNHPDVYGAEIEEDEAYERERALAENDSALPDVQAPSSGDDPSIQVIGERSKVTEGEKVADRGSHYPNADDSDVESKRQHAKAAKAEISSPDETSESETAAPKP